MSDVRSIIAASPTSFGTSGLRGLVEDIDDRLCHALTVGFLQHCLAAHALEPGSEVLVAQDLRPSSPRIALAILSALRAQGFNGVFCGAIPTPALALESLHRTAPAIMVTGSHIPFDRNGIKFYTPTGEITKQDEQAIVACTADLPEIDSLDALPAVNEAARAHYRARYETAFPALLASLRVGLYQHSAVGRDLNAELLEALGATVIPLGRSDVFVPIDTEAVSDADRDQAARWAQEHQLDALFSTDGDGDRPLLADENGHYFTGDQLGLLAARHLGVNRLVVPVSCTTSVERSGWFDQVERTRIGSPYVIAAMEHLARPDARVAGFEANGGFMTASPFTVAGTTLTLLPTRDAILPVLATLALAQAEGTTLAGLRQHLPGRSTKADRLQEIPRERSSALLDHLSGDRTALDAFLCDTGTIDTTDETDGLRVTLADGRIVHLRPSGNAPEFRIYVEAADDDEATALLQSMMAKVRSTLAA